MRGKPRTAPNYCEQYAAIGWLVAQFRPTTNTRNWIVEKGTVLLGITPTWFALAVFGAICVAPWTIATRFSWRFSLRTLLIAITLLGVGLGTIIVLSR